MSSALATALLVLPHGLYVVSDGHDVAEQRELWWVSDGPLIAVRQEQHRLPDDVATGCEARASSAVVMGPTSVTTSGVVGRGGLMLLDANVAIRCEVHVPAGTWQVTKTEGGLRLDGPTTLWLTPTDDGAPPWSQR